LNESKLKLQNSPVLTWDDTDKRASIGPGQSRPVPGVSTKLFKMTVSPADGPKLVVQLQAESAKHAKTYAVNRWPGAKVTGVKEVK